MGGGGGTSSRKGNISKMDADQTVNMDASWCMYPYVNLVPRSHIFTFPRLQSEIWVRDYSYV